MGVDATTLVNDVHPHMEGARNGLDDYYGESLGLLYPYWPKGITHIRSYFFGAWDTWVCITGMCHPHVNVG
jgi:hypothetical protein